MEAIKNDKKKPCDTHQKKWDVNKKSHFINIPIDDIDFITDYCKLCEEIKTASLNNFHQGLLQKPGKLHMTVCVLDLGEDELKINKVNELMSNINSEISAISNGKIIFNFENFECMGFESSARVLYAKMKEDDSYHKLMEIINLIIKTLVDEGLIKRSKLSEYHIYFNEEKQKYHIKLHMTLMNVLFLNKILKKQKVKEIRNFNAQEVLNYLNNKTMPKASIEKIHFSRMREDKLTEKYETIFSYSL